MAWITKACRHKIQVAELFGGRGRLPLDLVFLGLCRTVRGMFDQAFRRKFVLRAGIRCLCLSYLSQPFVLPAVNNLGGRGKAGFGDLDGEHGYSFFPSSSFLGRTLITYLNATIVFRTNYLPRKFKPHLDRRPTAD